MRVMLIGVDSLDPVLLRKFGAQLPNLTRLREESPHQEIQSVFPPDSIPAWISIFTGLNPAEHGVVYVFDVFNTHWQNILAIKEDVFRGKTFWDRASAAGKRVCVLFPMLAFPPWPVNGIMVSRSTDYSPAENGRGWLVKRRVEVYPDATRADFKIPESMIGVTGSPPQRSQLRRYAEALMASLREEGEIGLRVCRGSHWELFFITFSWLDIIQHLYWRYMDEDDPTHPGPTEHQDVILRAYQLIDKYVGEFMNLAQGAAVIVLSDHGHGRRPTTTVRINEFLRRKGYLVPKPSRIPAHRRLLEALKDSLLGASHRLDLDHLLLQLTRKKAFSRVSKSLYMSSASIDYCRSKAYLSSFAGAKSYPHGGIEINRQMVADGEYEALSSQIIEDLGDLTHPKSNLPLVEWAGRREELYGGKFIEQSYPDIVFQLRQGFGTNWGLFGGLIADAHEHRLSSGGHMTRGVLLAPPSAAFSLLGQPSLMDVAGILADTLRQ